MKYARRRDKNHNKIVLCFKAHGCTVTTLHSPQPGVPDLLIGYRGSNHLVEVKDPESSYGKHGLNPDQREWFSCWRGETPAVVSTVEQAIDLIKSWTGR